MVRLVEYDETLGAGSLLGEIGSFSPENRRTQGLKCVTDCEPYALTADRLYKLYYLNPELGFHMMRQVVARLLRDAAGARAATDMVLRVPTPGAAAAPPPPMAA